VPAIPLKEYHCSPFGGRLALADAGIVSAVGFVGVQRTVTLVVAPAVIVTPVAFPTTVGVVLEVFVL
jgi:hypothetical protein